MSGFLKKSKKKPSVQYVPEGKPIVFGAVCDETLYPEPSTTGYLIPPTITAKEILESFEKAFKECNEETEKAVKDAFDCTSAIEASEGLAKTMEAMSEAGSVTAACIEDFAKAMKETAKTMDLLKLDDLIAKVKAVPDPSITEPGVFTTVIEAVPPAAPHEHSWHECTAFGDTYRRYLCQYCSAEMKKTPSSYPLIYGPSGTVIPQDRRFEIKRVLTELYALAETPEAHRLIEALRKELLGFGSTVPIAPKDVPVRKIVFEDSQGEGS